MWIVPNHINLESSSLKKFQTSLLIISLYQYGLYVLIMKLNLNQSQIQSQILIIQRQRYRLIS